MRITNTMIYDSVIKNTNSALERYYALAEQNSSMRRINRPSDDAQGVGQALNLGDALRNLEQYQENIATADAWLSAADSALAQISDIITNIEELAEQAATETLSADQRAMCAEKVRENLEQLITLCNTEYQGQSIFAGQSTDENAYTMGLGVDLYGDGSLEQGDLVTVLGESEESVLARFRDSGTVGGGVDIGYEYSLDGGVTWTQSTLSGGSRTLQLGTCSLTLASGATLAATTDDVDGDLLVVRPAAVYQGDANDGASITHYGASGVESAVQGSITGKVLVRIDAAGDVSEDLSYSYSTDGGATWTTGQTSDNGAFVVPGGTLALSSGAGSTLAAGEQFVITPYSADLDVRISETGTVTINSVGKDVFGGLYQSPGQEVASAVEEPNLLETVGRLIGAMESDDTDEVGACLELLQDAHAQVEQYAAEIGSRESRLEWAESAVTVQSDNAAAAKSAIEDVDTTTLMVKLEAAETVYKSVVETSTNIMALSLVNYL